jgi:hypothetical protein
MPVIIDGTTGINSPAAALTVPLPVTSGGTGASSLSGITTGTATNIAGGSSGVLPFQTGSSATSFTAAGTSGQVLTSAGAGTPTWTTPSAGAMTFLAAVTASSSATVNFDSTYITSTYDTYMIVMNSVLPSTNSVVMSIDASSNNGSSFPYGWTNTGTGFSSNGTAAQGTGGGQNKLNGGLTATATEQRFTNAAGKPFNCTMYLFKPSAAQYFQCTWNATWISDVSSALCWVGMSATTNSSTAINYIRFAMSSGNIASGTFRLYGISNS